MWEERQRWYWIPRVEYNENEEENLKKAKNRKKEIGICIGEESR